MPQTVIKSTFTICSVTRYLGNGGYGRLLNSGGGWNNWLHGHQGSATGIAGVAFYGDGWKTLGVNQVTPNTNWVVMCGQNAGPNLKLVNGVDVGVATGGNAAQTLYMNRGRYCGGNMCLTCLCDSKCVHTAEHTPPITHQSSHRTQEEAEAHSWAQNRISFSRKGGPWRR